MLSTTEREIFKYKKLLAIISFVYLNLIYTKICNAGTKLIFFQLIPYEFFKKALFLINC